LSPKQTIVIDPGHGGSDPGTTAGGIIEKTMNLETAIKFAERIQAKYDVEVVMTRTTDVDVALNARPAMANRLDGDPLFISFHHNSSGGSTKPRGFETYVYGEKSWVMSKGKYASRSFQIAKAMEPALKAMCASVGLNYVGIKDGNFAVLRYCDRRAILFESFYASNPDDVAIATKPDFIDRLVDGYIEAVAQALSLTPKSSLFNDVAPDAWYADDIAELKRDGLVSGDENGNLGFSHEAIRLLVILNRSRRVDASK